MRKQNLSFHKNKKDLLPKVILIIITGLLWLSLENLQKVTAQSSTDPWTTPVNLSHSGATTDPILVVDTNNTVHVVWQDAHTGSIYSRFDGKQWSPPKIVKFPFGNSIPRLISDAKGRIYAFWTDSQNVLSYSFVDHTTFGDPKAWEPAHWLADSALGYDITVDAKNHLHLVYSRSLATPDYPAGVYYRHATDSASWSPADILYLSPYFSDLTSSRANVKIANSSITNTTQLYVVWDNPARKQINLVKSEDDGKTWGTPVEVDGPKPDSGSLTPLKISTMANNNKLILIWQVGELPPTSGLEGSGTSGSTINDVSNCTQHFKISSDGGKTWSKTQEILKDLKVCIQDYQYFPVGNDSTLLMLSTTQNQVFLVAWDGKSWSTPQAQNALSGFDDPEIFNPVKYACRQTNQIGNEKLVVVGCDTGGGGDIWATSRSLGSLKEWFPPPPVWNSPISIATSQSEILSPNAVAGPGEQLHVFWNQADETNPNTQAIYYTNLEGTRWSRVVAVLSSPEGKTGQPVVKLDSKGRLLATWSGGKSGQIYFSWANAEKAANKSEWIAAQDIPSPTQGATSPDIIADKKGTIYIVFAIPLNEHRGIYITQSIDDGNTWSDPVKVFDGAKAGWEMVNQPQLVLTPDGSLHVFWTRYTLPGGDGSLGIYEARSEINGKTWSTPETMVEGSVKWSQALGSDQGPLQLVWIEQNSGREVIKHQYSQDNGITWNRTATISNLTNIQGQPGATTDSAGRLHLLVVSQESSNNLTLKHLMWDGQKWISEDNSDISQDSALKVGSVAAGITPAGKLDVIFSGMTIIKQSSLPQFDLFFTNRSIDVPKTEVFAMLPTSSPVIPTLIERKPGPIGTSTPTPTPDESIKIPISQLQSGSPQGGNKYLGLILGSGLALLIAILFLGFRLRSIRSGKG